MNKAIFYALVCIMLFGMNGIYAQKPGLYVDGRHLYTPSGEKLILKGFNAMIVYWDLHGEINFPDIEKCFENEIGYLPWVWRWTDCHSCITYNPGNYGDWTNEPWGESVSVSHQYSIKNTAIRPPGMITSLNHFPQGSDNLKVFPNPFSAGITFQFNAEKQSKLSLKIYTVTGEQVAVLEDESTISGLYQTEWNPGDKLASGIYLYKLFLENSETASTRFGKCIKN